MKEGIPHDQRPCLLVFRSDLLPFSETFIRAQAEAVKGFRVVYAGMRTLQGGLPLHREVETLCAPSSRLCSYRIALYDKLGLARSFNARLRRQKPDVIHAHFAYDGLRAAKIARQFKIPLFVTLHGYDVTRRANYQAVFTDLWKQADRFLCVSEFIRQAAIRAGFPERKLVVQYTGIDLTTFGGRERPASEAPPIVLFVGRLAEKKGCIYLLQAMAEVQRSVPDAVLQMIGDGPEREKLEREAATLGVRVDFRGRQQVTEIHRAMSQAAVFCAPSLEAEDGDSEGLGMVFLEAQASELPVVSTYHGGIPEAVRAGTSGLLAPVKDPKALARCILEYLKQPKSRREAGSAGRAFVEECFDLERRTAELESLYREAMQAYESGGGSSHRAIQ